MKKVRIVLECDGDGIFSEQYFRTYVKDAVQTWCKSYDPRGDEFNIGDHIKLLPKKKKAARIARS